jgi:hypothetical protein
MRDRTSIRGAVGAVTAVSVVLACLIPLSLPAEAAPAISIAPSEGPAGTQVTVVGVGFAEQEQVVICLGPRSCANLGRVTADVFGGFSRVVTIPADASDMTTVITACGTTSRECANSPFAVVNPTTTVPPTTTTILATTTTLASTTTTSGPSTTSAPTTTTTVAPTTTSPRSTTTLQPTTTTSGATAGTVVGAPTTTTRPVAGRSADGLDDDDIATPPPANGETTAELTTTELPDAAAGVEAAGRSVSVYAPIDPEILAESLIPDSPDQPDGLAPRAFPTYVPPTIQRQTPIRQAAAQDPRGPGIFSGTTGIMLQTVLILIPIAFGLILFDVFRGKRR